MSKQISGDGGPAFPMPTGPEPRIHPTDGITHYNEGMSLRDYFAAAALQGLMATPNGPTLVKEAVAAAWHAADVMLKAREAKL